MKKSVSFFAAMLFAANLAVGQQQELDPFFKKYRDETGFMHTYLTKNILKLAIKTEDEDLNLKKLHELVREFGSLSILAAEENTAAKALYKEALGHVPRERFSEVLSVQDKTDRAKLWVQHDEQYITDLIFLMGANDAFVLVAFEGVIDLNKLMELTQIFGQSSADRVIQNVKATHADFSISPNPSTGRFVFTNSTGGADPQRLVISDPSGRQLRVIRVQGEASQEINVEDLPNGTYWVQLLLSDGKIGVKQLQILR
jgi:Domain of unknown function (DUF4252)/Secretion system C-terminal sorting domain